MVFAGKGTASAVPTRGNKDTGFSPGETPDCSSRMSQRSSTPMRSVMMPTISLDLDSQSCNAIL